MYSPGTKSAIIFLDKVARKNSEKLNKEARHEIANAKRLIDLQCEIASYFVGWWSSEVMPPIRDGHEKLSPLLFSAFHKNIFNFYSAAKLTLGLFGPARPIIRNIYEWLMISKFSILSKNSRIIERWHEEETIYFTNSILKKITIPDPKPFSEFWAVVCDLSHATRTSVQISINIDDNWKDVLFNPLTLIRIDPPMLTNNNPPVSVLWD